MSQTQGMSLGKETVGMCWAVWWVVSSRVWHSLAFKVVLGNFAQVCCILEHCRSHSHILPLQQAVSFPLVHLLSKTGVFTKIKRLSAISGESLTALYVPTRGSEGPAHIQAQVVPLLQTNCWPQGVSGQEILLPVCVSITWTSTACPHP